MELSYLAGLQQGPVGLHAPGTTAGRNGMAISSDPLTCLDPRADECQGHKCSQHVGSGPGQQGRPCFLAHWPRAMGSEALALASRPKSSPSLPCCAWAAPPPPGSSRAVQPICRTRTDVVREGSPDLPEPNQCKLRLCVGSICEPRERTLQRDWDKAVCRNSVGNGQSQPVANTSEPCERSCMVALLWAGPALTLGPCTQATGGFASVHSLQ